MYLQIPATGLETVYVATRPSTTAAFSTPTPLGGGVANTSGPDLSSVSDDQRTLIFAWNYYLCFARRIGSSQSFGPIDCVPTVSAFKPRVFNHCKGVFSNHSAGGCYNEDLWFWTRP